MINKQNDGFTLVELMVVVALIAILGVISIKYLDSSRRRSICADIETAAHETLLEAVKYASQFNQQPPANATSLGVNMPASVANIKVSGTGAVGNPITVNGTAVGDKCPLGQSYILVEGAVKGSWQ